MEVWIPITIAAAFFQNLRSALQKTLKTRLSTWGATGARFVFAAPFALALLGLLLVNSDQNLPGITADFLSFAVLGGVAQILATGLLIHLFSYQNFTVATAFTKTEPIQVAIFGIVLLGDHISLPVGAAILTSLIGVGLISLPKGRLKGRQLFDRKAFIGILSGALFGLSAIAYRGASLSLLDGGVFLRAVTTLAFVTSLQTALILIWIRAREPGQIRQLFKHSKTAIWVGVSGMLGSLAWFIAFTLENAAHVRAVGQIEIVFMIGASVFIFKEQVSLREIMGVVFVFLGILGLTLVA